jgi:hypothetical protein
LQPSCYRGVDSTEREHVDAALQAEKVGGEDEEMKEAEGNRLDGGTAAATAAAAMARNPTARYPGSTARYPGSTARYPFAFVCEASERTRANLAQRQLQV